MSRNYMLEVHRRHLTALLSVTIKQLPQKIAFKGGTCALFFYKLPRFSFDLDFDILRPLSPKEIMALRSALSREGRIVDWKDKHFTLLGEFDYGHGCPNIKMEFNRRVWKNNSYKTVWFLGMPLLIADETTILTNKLIVLTDRPSPVARDLYDIWYFLQMGFAINPALIKERTGKDQGVYLKKVIDFIMKTFTARNILQGLGETLEEQQKVWARKQLILETVAQLRDRANPQSRK